MKHAFRFLNCPVPCIPCSPVAKLYVLSSVLEAFPIQRPPYSFNHAKFMAQCSRWRIAAGPFSFREHFNTKPDVIRGLLYKIIFPGSVSPSFVRDRHSRCAFAFLSLGGRRRRVFTEKKRRPQAPMLVRNL